MLCFEGRLAQVGMRVKEEEKSKCDSGAKVPVLFCRLESPGKLIKISMPSLYLCVC